MKTKKPRPGRGWIRNKIERIASACRGLIANALLAGSVGAGLTPRAMAEDATASGKSSANEDLTKVDLETLMGYKVQSVYTASKHEQKISEAPSSVTVIDSDEIKKYGYRSFADILRSVRGLYVTYDRNYSYLGVRGFNRPGDFNSRILVLINGHRINDNVFDQALLGHEFPLDVDLIDRIEVIRGPGSSIYGNNAFFGVINVITKAGKDFQGGEVSGATGSFGTASGRFSYGRKFTNDVQFLLSGSYYNSDGPGTLYYPEFNQPGNNVNHGIASQVDYETFAKGFASLSYNDFSLEGIFSSREKGIPTGSYGTIFNDDRAKTTDDRAYLNLKYHHNFSHGLELTASLFYDYYGYYGDYPLSYAPGTSVLYKDIAHGSWWGTEVQANQKFFDRLTLTLGLEFRDNINQDQRSYDDQPRAVYCDDHHDSRNFAVYGQAEFLILTNFILNAGVRYDHYDTFGETLNPRLGLIYSPVDSTTFKAIYGTAFKAPNAYELYYAGVNLKGNLDLRPEKIRTYELVYEQKLGKHLQFSASGFYYKINGLINQTTDPSDGLLVYENVDNVSAYGVEAELEGKFSRGLRGRLSYTYQRTKDGDEALSNSPRHLGKFNLIVPLYQDKIFSGLELQYNGAVKTLSRATADDFFVANVTLFSHKLIKNLEASVSVYNLFDQKYFNPGAGEHIQDQIQQDGRTWWLKLNYRF